MPYRSDDPVRDFLRHDAELADELEKLPKCGYCEHPIQDEKCYEFDGMLICSECLNEHHLRWTEHYVED